MNSACVDLIYLDPPFNSKKNYEAPVGGDKNAIASFKDTWTLSDVDVCEHGELAEHHPAAYFVIQAAREAHGKSMMSYLIMMAVRLIEMRRVLKPTGSIYLHCDPHANSYLRLLMDAIFGQDNFRNEIIWSYRTGGASKRWFAKKHDNLLFYAKGKNYVFNVQKEKSYNRDYKPYNFKGVKEYQDEYGRWFTMASMRNVWEINAIGRTSGERLGYPTQKPLALLERIIKASSNEGDFVLDPFCGCATTLVAADRLSRQWAGIDLSKTAIRLVNDRIKAERGMFGGATALTDAPPRTDLGEIPHYRTQKQELFGRQQGFCIGCKDEFPFRIFEVDHILPQSRGGTDHIDNLQLLCNYCNRSKGKRTMAEWRAAQK